MLSGVEDPRESTVVLLQKVPRRFLFSLFSIRKKFLNIYSLAANFLVTIVCNIIRFWLKYIEGRYINCGTVVRETLGLEICCVIRVRTFPFTTIIRIYSCETLTMILAMRSHGSEGYLKLTRRHLFGLYFFVSVGCLACFVTCCNNILAIFLSIIYNFG